MASDPTPLPPPDAAPTPEPPKVPADVLRCFNYSGDLPDHATAVVRASRLRDMARRLAYLESERDATRAERDGLGLQLGKYLAQRDAAERERDEAQTLRDDADAVVEHLRVKLAEAEAEAGRLLIQRKELADVLRCLHDQQNGPPLPKYGRDWHDAMNRAGVILAEVEPEIAALATPAAGGPRTEPAKAGTDGDAKGGAA